MTPNSRNPFENHQQLGEDRGRTKRASRRANVEARQSPLIWKRNKNRRENRERARGRPGICPAAGATPGLQKPRYSRSPPPALPPAPRPCIIFSPQPCPPSRRARGGILRAAHLRHPGPGRNNARAKLFARRTCYSSARQLFARLAPRLRPPPSPPPTARPALCSFELPRLCVYPRDGPPLAASSEREMECDLPEVYRGAFFRAPRLCCSPRAFVSGRGRICSSGLCVCARARPRGECWRGNPGRRNFK